MKDGNGQLLVTGASGFVGTFLCRRLLAGGFAVRGTLLAGETPAALVPGVQPVLVEPLGAATSWQEALAGIKTVIHLAARVHIMEDPSADPLEEFRKVNVEGTLKLAREAAKAGVTRFVFISSIKVNGEESPEPYSHDAAPHPTDPYGVSKWEAEIGLRSIANETGLELVVVRPTLVYGPGVKANFFNMLKAVRRGIPLPLASINNRRSLTYVGNLADALAVCAVHPGAAGNTYLVSDGEDVSTAQLIRRAAAALGVPARLLPFPVALMKWAGRLTGRSAIVQRLTGSLTVDGSSIRNDLGWQPPFSMEQGLWETAQWFKKE
jgi:nucleoside-diphosphate-sugar epimerase